MKFERSWQHGLKVRLSQLHLLHFFNPFCFNLPTLWKLHTKLWKYPFNSNPLPSCWRVLEHITEPTHTHTCVYTNLCVHESMFICVCVCVDEWEEHKALEIKALYTMQSMNLTNAVKICVWNVQQILIASVQVVPAGGLCFHVFFLQRTLARSGATAHLKADVGLTNLNVRVPAELTSHQGTQRDEWSSKVTGRVSHRSRSATSLKIL